MNKVNQLDVNMGEINSGDDTSPQVDEELVQDEENFVSENEIDVIVETIEEEVDPLEQALARAEKAEKEIAYKEAEIQNVRKRMMAEKATAIKYGSMGLSRRMIGVLDDFDRAINNLENDSWKKIKIVLQDSCQNMFEHNYRFYLYSYRGAKRPL